MAKNQLNQPAIREKELPKLGRNDSWLSRDEAAEMLSLTNPASLTSFLQRNIESLPYGVDNAWVRVLLGASSNFKEIRVKKSAVEAFLKNRPVSGRGKTKSGKGRIQSNLSVSPDALSYLENVVANAPEGMFPDNFQFIPRWIDKDKMLDEKGNLIDKVSSADSEVALYPRFDTEELEEEEREEESDYDKGYGNEETPSAYDSLLNR